MAHTAVATCSVIPVTEEVFDRYYQGQQLYDKSRLDEATLERLDADLEPFETRIERAKDNVLAAWPETSESLAA